MKNAQENLRLSAATQSKLNRELNEFRAKYEQTTIQSESFRKKM